MKLSELIRDIDIIKIHGDTSVDVTGIYYDSRKVSQGGLFVAIPGLKHDGHGFIPEVYKRGAIAVVGEKRKENLPDNVPSNLTYIQVKRSRRALAQLATAFYGHPSRNLVLVGITGTNGKTTTSFLLESIFRAWNKRAGVIGTINYRYAGIKEKAPVTTPESLDLQELFARMLKHGVSHVVMEVSSHALDLDRVYGCDFDAAVFTNLSQDHLDYHENLDTYFKCKLKLFCEHLAESQVQQPIAVVNIDDKYGQHIPNEPFYRMITYSLERGADIYPVEWKVDGLGINAVLDTPSGKMEIRSPLLGRLNLYNIMAAVGTSVGLAVPTEAIRKGLANISRVSGRLENVPNDLGISVIVDYAHTPDAMEKALECVKEFCEGRLIVVFGCGGDRDRTKRPLMGEVAARYGDIVIVTSDNPRSEDPMRIIEDIRVGVERGGCHFLSGIEEIKAGLSGYVVEPDRKKAIWFAIELAEKGDLVFIGGKGHEDYQILGDRIIHFDDREEALKAIENKKVLIEQNSMASAVNCL